MVKGDRELDKDCKVMGYKQLNSDGDFEQK